MSTSLLYHAFGTRGYRYVRTAYTEGPQEWHHAPVFATLAAAAQGSPLNVLNAHLFLRLVMLNQLPLVDGPVHIVVGVMALLTALIEAVGTLRLGCRRFVGRRFVRVHQRQQFRIEMAVTSLLDVQTARPVAAFTADVLQEGCRRLAKPCRWSIPKHRQLHHSDLLTPDIHAVAVNLSGRHLRTDCSRPG